MKNKKNLVIGLLIGLLALSLFTQPAQSASTNKSPVSLTRADLITIAQSVPYISVSDQTELIEYKHCLDRYNLYYADTGVQSIPPSTILGYCVQYKP